MTNTQSNTTKTVVAETNEVKRMSIPETAKLRVVVENPYLEGSTVADEFDAIRNGMKVSTAIARGVSRRTIRHAVANNFIVLA
jgi:hypothetical protein